MKSLLLKLAFISLGFPLNGSAQNYDNMLLYEKTNVKELINFRIPDSTHNKRFTEQDWVMLSPMEETRTETRTITEEGMETNTFLISGSSRAEEWELMPLRILSDAEGISIYDAENHMVNYLPHSNSFLLGMDSLRELRLSSGIPVMVELPKFQDLDQESLLQAGAVITGTEKTYKIKTSTGEIEVNHPDKYIIERVFQQEFDVPFYTYTSFQTSKQGFLKPRYKKTLTLVRSYSGFCIEKIHALEYSLQEYFVQPSSIYRSEGEANSKVFSIFPNPVSDILHIQVASSVLSSLSGDITYSVALYDNLNELVWQQQDFPMSQNGQVNLSFLPTGYYTLHIHRGDQINSFKLLKL